MVTTFRGFANAAYADWVNYKSTTGYIFLVTDGAITWKSNKQSITTQSSTEAEYITLWDAGKEALWLRNLYRKLGFSQATPTPISYDNTGAVAIVRNPQFHRWTKHIDFKFHWIREKVKEGWINLENCHTAKQTANMLTKALPCPKHKQHMMEMGIMSV